MKNKLKKWPKNWVEHVNETCFFYFEDNGISFIDSKILCSDKTADAEIYGIRLTFQRYKNTYDIFINHEYSTFITNYYYKNYYRFQKRNEINDSSLFMMDTLSKGSDQTGLFSYKDLGGDLAKDYKISAYEIAQSIEEFITYHNDKGSNDDNEGGEENDPIKPFSPSDVMEPEILNC
jgi:hypothetical protein